MILTVLSRFSKTNTRKSCERANERSRKARNLEVHNARIKEHREQMQTKQVEKHKREQHKTKPILAATSRELQL
jgi:hypothetical protein